jgi:chromosome segregation ATPase
LGLAAVVAGLLVGAAFLFRPRALQFLLRRPSGDDIPDDMPPEQHVLLLRAHVEKLQKEKGVLQADLGELRQERDKLLSAKEELEARLGEPSREYKEKSKVIKELEQRLEEAEKEAKSVQEEYMALYARSQQEKKELKKG